MISRNYDPSEGKTLYHYCSAATFHAICTGGNIRYSDLNSMNDSEEMVWGYKIWEETATKLMPATGKDFLDKVDNIIHSTFTRAQGVVACFSKSGDVLSQWRAYADDGRGYAIGFDAEVLCGMASTALEVLYEKSKQIEEVHDFVAAIHFMESMREAKYSTEFIESCIRLFFYLASFKNPNFSEEQEVRLLHSLMLEASGDSFKMVDNGGIAFGKHVPGKPVSFFMRDSAPVPYIDQAFYGSDKPAIKEIIIGPKNSVVSIGISIFLETLGHSGVEVRRSMIPYR
ncbi:DUF2971 domain-containing protein [Pseudomonas lijiangensis]|uniref:DUF2971 domain-containing protein n=1 Tax=Pseudomonas lijiangensis TaxID=2995658 RepID=UPI0031BB844B